jgi:hypothetical protein
LDICKFKFEICLEFGNCYLEFKSRGGEKLCQEEMELDLQDRDQEQAGVLEEAAGVDAWADHDLVQDQAATAYAHPAEL